MMAMTIERWIWMKCKDVTTMKRAKEIEIRQGVGILASILK